MRADPKKCITCGSRDRSTEIPFKDLPYFFCCAECYDKTVLKYVKEKKYLADPSEDEELLEAFDAIKTDYHTRASGPLFGLFNRVAWQSEKDYCDPRYAEIIKNWNAAKETVISDAEYEVYKRLRAEMDHEEQEELDKQAVQEEKERLKKEQEEASERELQEKLTPRPIPQHIRFEHTHILAPSGSGKTQMLQNSLIEDLIEKRWFDKETNTTHFEHKEKPPAYIVIDPKGLMIERLSKLAIFSDEYVYGNKLVIIDPFDAPALNLFKTLGRDPAQLVSDFSYIFSTTRQKLTGKQLPCFAFCARLLFTLPTANLQTLLDLLDDGRDKRPRSPLFQRALPKLPDIARRFFEQDYYSSNYASTREEIKARVYGVAQNEHLANMFNASTRKLDLAKCIKERKIVLVNTRMTELAEDHQTLGRYIITLVQDAIQSVKPSYPVYLVIDEAQEFMDAEKTPRLLRLLREYNGGAVLAHQNMFCLELDDAMRNAISTNTSIKYCASPEGRDLRYMVSDMRCDEEFLKNVHKTKTHAQFACFVRGMTPPLKHPFIVETELGWINKWPKMSDADYKALRATNKAALADTHEPTKKDDPPKVQVMTAEDQPNKPTAIEKQNTSKSQPQTPPTADPTDAGDEASEW
jgi:hypothetical protein